LKFQRFKELIEEAVIRKDSNIIDFNDFMLIFTIFFVNFFFFLLSFSCEFSRSFYFDRIMMNSFYNAYVEKQYKWLCGRYWRLPVKLFRWRTRVVLWAIWFLGCVCHARVEGSFKRHVTVLSCWRVTFDVLEGCYVGRTGMPLSL
jgi:hypothetical protein